MNNLHVILHATDFSNNAHHALKLACRLARDSEAQLVVLHVAPPLPNQWAGSSLSLLQSYKGRWEQENRLRRLDCQGLWPERLLKSGTPAPVIVRVAKELNADLIVMGQPQSDRWRWLIAERVVEAVVRTAPCPVLVAAEPAAESVEAHHVGAQLSSENEDGVEGRLQLVPDDRQWRS